MASSHSDGDRFSNLPVNVAHHILMFLDIEHLSELIQVCKKCKEFCMTTPYLTVDNRSHTTSLNRYQALVERFLALRLSSKIEIKKFNFTWYIPEKKVGRKRKSENEEVGIQWSQNIHNLYTLPITRCGVISLRVKFLSEKLKPVCIPPTLFAIGTSLKKLVISGNNFPVHLPKLDVQLSSLDTLVLDSVKICSESEVHFLVGKLRSLKKLYLYCCSGLRTLSVSSLSIEDFAIMYERADTLNGLYIMCPNLLKLRIKWCSSFASPNLLLEAPRLEFFQWIGIPYGSFSSLSSFPLKEVEIMLSRPTVLVQCVVSAVPVHLMKALLQKLISAKSIKLHMYTLKLLCYKGLLPLPLPLQSRFLAETLSLEFCLFTCGQVHPVGSLLTGMPDLKMLRITSSLPGGRVKREVQQNRESVKGFNVDFWDGQNIKFLQLKSATIEVHGGGNDLEFVKFLLKQAASLENLQIICGTELRPTITGLVEGYGRQSLVVTFSSNV